MRRGLLLAFLACVLAAAPTWRFPREMPVDGQGRTLLPFGQLTPIDLVEPDPALPAPPRPGDERLGTLQVRAVVPLPDGRGWRLTLQPLRSGMVRLAPVDLGNGQKTPELRLNIPRTTAFGAAWMGLGGGPEDRLPPVPFPWWWATLLLLPALPLLVWVLRQWRRGRQGRAWHKAKAQFISAWPPATRERSALDAGHAAGRTLLALRFGDAALSWGADMCQTQGLPTWAKWIQSLDSARFGRSEPPFPEREALLREAEAKP